MVLNILAFVAAQEQIPPLRCGMTNEKELGYRLGGGGGFSGGGIGSGIGGQPA